ncbi:tol-pal system protein YbgF [Beijerinckia mobilis]|uniref:tol-pal system protein YbgF n=1 Tax=Beijerinckia mobilis TaxID=231434 RepID=UPI000A01FF15|nr:tol-pal system protein YbgF [Beijerinckia mobilis]
MSFARLFLFSRMMAAGRLARNALSFSPAIWPVGLALLSPAVAQPLEAGTNGGLYAQNYDYAPNDYGDGGYGRAPAQDSAGLLVRIDKLENQVRQLTGQIEQMQFTTRKLEDQLKKFQEDVDFRLQESGNAGRGAAGTPTSPAAAPRTPQRRGDVTDGIGALASQLAEDGDGDLPPAVPTGKNGRRRDAFDPAADPDAPGAPRSLGTTPAANRRAETVNAPLDLAGGRLRAEAAPQHNDAAAPAASTTLASVPANPVREDFDLALGYFRQKEYENAEKSFTAFLAKNGKNRLAPDAIFYLGETYYRRGRQREAAEQYLKISTHYPNTGRAPEAMLRLGQSLIALGAKEQACATFAEIDRKYPNASAQVKANADREAKRLQC